MKQLKVGSLVFVQSGKHKGQTGKINKISLATGRVWLEGVGMVKRHQKKSAQHPQGGIVEKQLSLAISVVMPVDPSTKKPVRKSKLESKKK